MIKIILNPNYHTENVGKSISAVPKETKYTSTLLQIDEDCPFLHLTARKSVYLSCWLLIKMKKLMNESTAIPSFDSQSAEDFFPFTERSPGTLIEAHGRWISFVLESFSICTM